MDLKILTLCIFAVISLSLGENAQQQQQNQQNLNLDRGRSAWNFGGLRNHAKRTTQPLFRSGNVAEGGVLANRRHGSGKLRKYSHKKTGLRQGVKPTITNNNPKPDQGKQTKTVKRNTIAAAPYRSQAIPLFSNGNNKRSPIWSPSSSWNMRQNSRSDQIQARSDTIFDRFRKEDLWHLDKGESYELRNEDIERDLRLRGPVYETNDIGFGDEETHKENDENDFKGEEMAAEHLVNSMEKEPSKHKHSPDHQHIHHHHHPSTPKQSNKDKEAEKKPAAAPATKKPDPTVVTPLILPRIHNPIPLGCILPVPAFHPIRPRHHLACLLAIPGTPNMMKRRRKRSASPSSATDFLKAFGNSHGMTPVFTRKHYANHVGNGKNPQATRTPPPPQVDIKVPATIIAPPKFENSDILQMLLGSQGLKINDMGTVLATNSRYVRFGRGLPGNGGGGGPPGGRQGRHLQWNTNSNNNNNNVQGHQQVMPSSSNSYPVIVKPSPPAYRPMTPQQPPQVALPQPVSNASNGKSQPPPVILNLNITPFYSSPPKPLEEPSPPQLNNNNNASIPTVSNPPTGKWKKHEYFKQPSDWKPIKNVTKSQSPDSDLVTSDDATMMQDESKVHFAKVRPPISASLLRDSSDDDDEELDMVKSVDDDTNVPTLASSNDKKKKKSNVNVEDTKGLQSWIDNVYRLKKQSKNENSLKSFSFATKKNKNKISKANLDDEDDTMAESSSSHSEMMRGSLFDDLDFEEDDYHENDVVDVSESERVENIPGRYYKVKKLLLDQLPDPIIISVPKENDLNDYYN